MVLQENRLQQRHGVDHENTGCWCGGHEEPVSGVQAADMPDAGREPEMALPGNGFSSASLGGDDYGLLNHRNGNGLGRPPTQSTYRRPVGKPTSGIDGRHGAVQRRR